MSVVASYNRRLRDFALGRTDEFRRADGALMRRSGNRCDVTFPDGRCNVAQFSEIWDLLLEITKTDDPDVLRNMFGPVRYDA